MRTWPRLEIIVDVPTEGTTQFSEVHDANMRHPTASLSTISWGIFREDRGAEIPYYESIKVRGTVQDHFRKMIADHRCPFGDCIFQEHVIEYAGSVDRAGGKYKYLWQKDDEQVIDDSEENQTAIAAGMHQWIPRLPKEWYAAILEEDLQTS